MLNLINIFNKSTKIKNYIIINTVLILCFTVLYLISDIFLDNYPELANKLGLGSITKVGSFYSYLYYSLITQTTVGYGGTLPDGKNIIDIKSNLFKFFSGLQLYSIIIITAYTLS